MLYILAAALPLVTSSPDLAACICITSQASMLYNLLPPSLVAQLLAAQLFALVAPLAPPRRRLAPVFLPAWPSPAAVALRAVLDVPGRLGAALWRACKELVDVCRIARVAKDVGTAALRPGLGLVRLPRRAPARSVSRRDAAVELRQRCSLAGPVGSDVAAALSARRRGTRTGSSHRACA